MTVRTTPARAGAPATGPAPGAVWTGLGDLPSDWPGCAVTVGVFDGFHRGHTALVRRVRERAHREVRRVLAGEPFGQGQRGAEPTGALDVGCRACLPRGRRGRVVTWSTPPRV